MNLLPPLGLAPIAGITHRAFRRLVAEIGGASFFYTEMLNSRIVAHQNPFNDPCCLNAGVDRPLVAQLVGGDPEIMTLAVERLEPLGFDAYDINMGCPQKAITRHGWEAALLEHPKQAISIVRAVKKATKRPLFVKFRSFRGHDVRSLINFSKELESEGVDLIVLHPRSVDDGFKRPCRWEEIGMLKRKLQIPVYGNGDVFRLEDLERFLGITGADGVLIGRGALVRPWIFWECIHHRPWQGSPMEVLRRVAVCIETYLPEEQWERKFRIFLLWFLRNWQHNHFLSMQFRRELRPVETAMYMERFVCSHGLEMARSPIFF